MRPIIEDDINEEEGLDALSLPPPSSSHIQHIHHCSYTTQATCRQLSYLHLFILQNDTADGDYYNYSKSDSSSVTTATHNDNYVINNPVSPIVVFLWIPKAKGVSFSIDWHFYTHPQTSYGGEYCCQRAGLQGYVMGMPWFGRWATPC